MKIIVEYYDPETDKKETNDCLRFRHIKTHDMFEFVPNRGNIIKPVTIVSPSVDVVYYSEQVFIVINGFQYITSSGGYWKTETRITISA
jgi:hypothetical protein